VTFETGQSKLHTIDEWIKAPVNYLSSVGRPSVELDDPVQVGIWIYRGTDAGSHVRRHGFQIVWIPHVSSNGFRHQFRPRVGAETLPLFRPEVLMFRPIRWINIEINLSCFIQLGIVAIIVHVSEFIVNIVLIDRRYHFIRVIAARLARSVVYDVAKHMGQNSFDGRGIKLVQMIEFSPKGAVGEEVLTLGRFKERADGLPLRIIVRHALAPC
jgi:hypothetical protein